MSEDVPFNSVVLDAAKNGDITQLAQVLISHGHLIDTPNPEQPILTPLHAAAENGHPQVIELLLDAGSKAIDAKDSLGRTPLHLAAEAGHVDVVEALIRLGSSAIDQPDNYGRTPTTYAADKGQVAVIEALVRLGSQTIDLPEEHGATPLLKAASSGHSPVVEALIRLGSQALDTPDKDGNTPMHAAASNGHVEVLSTLRTRTLAGLLCSWQRSTGTQRPWRPSFEWEVGQSTPPIDIACGRQFMRQLATEHPKSSQR